MNAEETILAHKRQAEMFFAASVNANCEFDQVRQNAGWLRPDQIQDERVSRFWMMCLDGRPANQAALDCTLLMELSRIDNGVNPIFGREAVYAQAIVDDEYLLAAMRGANDIANIAIDRRVEDVRRKVAEMGTLAPSTAIDIPDSTDIGLRFMATLGQKNRVVKTGIGSIDKAIGGLSRKTLTLLAARPSMGKTTLGLQWALWNASHGMNVLFFSLEMSSEQLWSKIICGRSGVSPEKYKSGDLSEEENERIREVHADLTEHLGGRVHVDDKPDRNSAFIWQACAQYRPDLLIVDHLALVRDKHENEVKRLGMISKSAKAIAKEFDLCAVYLMQLNRGTEVSGNHRPGLASLRGSGELEEDADNVLFIHREDYYKDTPTDVSETDLIVAKNREGIMNDCAKMMFVLAKQEFYGKADYARQK